MKVMLNLPGGEGKLLLVKYIRIVAVSNVSGINSCTEVVLLEQDMETVARGNRFHIQFSRAQKSFQFQDNSFAVISVIIISNSFGNRKILYF